MLSETLPERSDDVDSLNASAAYIFQVFSRYGSPQYQDSEVWGIPYRNVILHLGPGTGEAVVVGSHYDTAEGLSGCPDSLTVALEVSKGPGDGEHDIGTDLLTSASDQSAGPT